MNILLFGANGQVGWELKRSLAVLGTVIAPERSTPGGDLLRLDELSESVLKLRPDVIVNAAAYTAVDQAETDVGLAHAINAMGPAQLATLARDMGAWLVHYSTDYVFDGSGSAPWRELDTPSPLNRYGAGKLAGEKAIQNSGCLHIIFRTSWVYASRGKNFTKTITRLAREREQVHIVDDQFGAPTGAELLADATAHALGQALAYPELAGLYHLTAQGETSWYDYAHFIVHTLRRRQADIRLKPQGIHAVSTADYPTAAQRPLNCRLDSRLFSETFKCDLPRWEAGVERVITEMQEAAPC